MSDGIAVDLRIVPVDEFPFALVHFTGSKEHTAALRRRARKRGLTLDERGLSDGGARITCDTETEIYERLGLRGIPPELRENLGELRDYEREAPSPLITLSDLRGVIHFHTTRSDGKNTLAEMVDAARATGASYVGLADHSQAATYANGLTPERVLEQFDEVDAHNRNAPDIRVLKGIEVDILGDGALDYDDELLARFDFVIASVHSAMKLSETKMMERIERALRHPSVNIFGHPTGRLLLKRDAYAVDMDRVVRMAVDFGVALEINAHPQRLDTDWRVIRRSRDLGVRYVICPDAHRTGDLAYSRYGVDVARKGGLARSDVLNTLGADRFLQQLRGLKQKSH
jgi:DNA polymerase (family 10)